MCPGPWDLRRPICGGHPPTSPPKKTRCGACGQERRAFYDQRPRRVRDLSCGDRRVYLEFSIRRVWCRRCGGVKREGLGWLADNPLYTKRFAFYVGRRCRESTVRAIAEELPLDWETVKELDKQYMREQLRRAGCPAPRVIGIDEIAVGRRHTYRIVVSDLERGRPIWFGGKDRSEASLDEFFAWLGPEKCRRIRLAVMDMWKAFRKSTLKEGHAPQARIIYDKFHVMGHLGKAMDEVRRREYARLSGKDRRFIKGQRYNLLSREENLTTEGKQALKLLFRANKRLHTAYLLKESFDQLWDYSRPGWARRFFANWKGALKWQRLEPFRKFARMVEAHWDGIEAYCHEDNKVPLGFVEGLNNKIRVIQRRAHGYRDEEYFRLKILTCMLPRL
jgi:transposase